MAADQGPAQGDMLRRLREQLPERRDDWGKYVVGDYTYGMPAVRSWGEEAMLHIGKFCSIADQVTVFLGGEHRVDWVTTYPFSALLPEYAHIEGHPRSKGDVHIGNDVWIGHGVMILSGVHIGDGAVIAAKAVVTRDVPPYAVVAGNPAAVVKNRFDLETVTRLLTICWWDWELSHIEGAIPLLLSGDMEAFLHYAEHEVTPS